MLRIRNNNCLLPIVLLVVCGSTTAWADIGSPVKIRLVKELVQPAVAGEEYQGAFEVLVGADGTLDSITVEGVGWRGLEVDAADLIDVQAGDVLRFHFTGTPGVAQQSVRVRLVFDGRPVTKSFDLSPERFARLGKPGRVVSVDAQGRAVPFQPQGGGERVTTVAGQSLHLFGRIAYQRPTSPSDPTLITVGAGSLWFEIMDEDDIFDETIFSGYTDAYGYFDLNITWDDCDISGCDDPDIYIRWETDNDVVNVQRDDLLEEDYSWSTEDDPWDDFEGSEINFGTLMPGDPAQFPAMHIHNSIMRAYHYILLQSGTGIDVEEVDVQWPEDPDRSYYNTFYEEIHIGPSRQWNEDTHTHEYGHHFLENYSVNPEPDYCNGVCDTDDNCSHCSDCSETDHDAWNEGWPNWLADVVTRSYPLDYLFDDGTPFQPYKGRSQENVVTTCSVTGMPNDPLRTESYAGALCRDIEDGAQDDHSGGTFNCNGPTASLDCTTDALALGVDEIFTVVTQDQPSTPLGFLQAFRNRFPQFDQDLWSTATNVDPAFSFVPPTTEVTNQTQECKMDMAGRPLSLNVQGNGSALRYQWERFNVDVNNDAVTTGAQCSTLAFNPLTEAHAGIYRAEVFTCDQSSSTMSDPIRVTVFPARGGGTNAAAFGRNDAGQLGNGLPYLEPALRSATPIAGLSGVVSVSGGDFFASALLSDGTVWAWGYCRYGECGSAPGPVSTPVQVPGISDVIAISSNGAYGGGHTLALNAEGTVWAWGLNYFGQLGVSQYAGTYGPTPIPIQVPQLNCVTSVAAGSFFSIASRSDGTVWTWGDNTYGELGNGTIGGWSYTPTEVPVINDAVAVNAGAYHALVLHSNGTVSAWGRNTEGQLGDGTFVTRGYPVLVAGLTSVRFVTAGVFHSLAILDDGAVRVWGDNSWGQLGTGDTIRATLPVQPIGITSALDIAGGAYHTAILRPDQTVWGCGVNSEGQLGMPSPPVYALTAVQIPGLVNVENVDAGDSQTFILSPGVGPAIYQQPAPRTVAAGEQAQFSVAALGSGLFTYQWRRGGDDLADGNGVTGANSATLTLNPTSGAMAGSYTVWISNLFGFAISLPASLTVNCVAGDANCDGFVDAQDAADFVDCLNGPGRPRPAECRQGAFAAFDANHDNDVDLRDAAVFQRCFAGDGEVVDPNCAN